MRTAHASRRSHHTRPADLPKSQRPQRQGITVPSLVGGLVGAFLGVALGYVAGVAIMWLLESRGATGAVATASFWQSLLKPGELALYTPLTMPIGFLLGGYLGEKIGRSRK